jgi:cell division protease FtsH
VRDLFRQANQKAPCIIFIDEIDAIGRSRDTRHMGGDSEREQTLNQLLSEMDGFDTSKGIVILAATNRPEVLDKALLRPGRFDRRVVVERPDLKGREDILKVHAKNVKQDETVDLHELALTTSGAVGADLANIINEAALLAVRKGRQFVSQKDLIESVEVVFAGKEKKNKILSDEEKWMVAYHETGHALMTVLQKNTVPVQKITIVPRTNGALGYVWQVPDEEKSLESQAEIEADIVIACAGRAAEALKFPSVTTGAASDIQPATEKARRMVTMYGMSEKFGMVQLEGITGEYLDRRSVLQCSDETETKIDNEVRAIIKRAYTRAFKALKKNESILDAIAAFLYEHETITGTEFVKIYEQVSGRKVDTSKRLLSDSLLKRDKEKTRDKVKTGEKEKAVSKERLKEREEKRKNGQHMVFRNPYIQEPQPEAVQEPEEEGYDLPDQDSVEQSPSDAQEFYEAPEAEQEFSEVAEAPDAMEEPEEETGPMPWETYAREQEEEVAEADAGEEVEEEFDEEEPEEAEEAEENNEEE